MEEEDAEYAIAIDAPEAERLPFREMDEPEYQCQEQDSIESTLGVGTRLTATLDTSSIDCLPLGDLPGTVTTLVTMNPDKPEFILHCRSPKGEMHFDTREIREALAGVPLNEPEIAAWMQESLREEIEPIFGGVIL